jgi:quercetin dioxygenase-like cupin family protein
VSIAQSTVIADTDHVRVTRWEFHDGDDTGHHRHEFDYVVVPVTGGSFSVVDNDGATHDMVQEAATPYLGAAGTEHNVINTGGRTAVFIDVELKR